jgi:energy-coupling factor transport system permease protein
MLALIGFVAILVVISGGNGFSYFVRMALVLFIGTWLYAEQKPGDFLSVAVWAFGKRTGFDMGMVGECAMQMAESLSRDLTRIQTAMSLKGQVWGTKNLVPAGLILIHDAMLRASDITELLAARGYRKGGSLCPVFCTSARDPVAGICAICAFFFAFIPVSEFFILYR